MPHKELQQAREQRNAALIETMLLAASADGEVRDVEMRAILTRVLERPEFEGTKPEALNALVEASAKRLAEARKLDDVLDSLRKRLPDHRNRLLAFGLAVAIALADRRASREELGLLKTFQRALGISEDEVGRVFDMVERGRSLAEALGEPSERLFAETMVLVAASDGEVKEAELLAMLESMAGDAAFHGLSLEDSEKALRDAMHNLATDGIPKRLGVLAQGLTTHAQRLKAFRLALKIAYVDSKPSARVLRTLELLQTTFGLADDEVARITAEH